MNDVIEIGAFDLSPEIAHIKIPYGETVLGRIYTVTAGKAPLYKCFKLIFKAEMQGTSKAHIAGVVIHNVFLLPRSKTK